VLRGLWISAQVAIVDATTANCHREWIDAVTPD